MRTYCTSFLVKFFIAILLFWGTDKSVFSQNYKVFTGKPENFTTDVSKFLNTEFANYKVGIAGLGIDVWGEEVTPDSAKIRLKTFAFSWDSSVFTQEQKTKILDLSKCLIDKKIRPFPDYFQFVNTLQLFIDNKHPETSFNQWLDAMNQYCDTKKRSINLILKLLFNTKVLLQEDVLFKSRSVVWKPSVKNISFNFSNNDFFVKVEKCNLICYSKRDSIVIFNTYGNYYPAEQTWKGQDGEITWERAGYEKNVITSFLSKYHIDFNKSSFEADSVRFTNMVYFDKPLLGKLEHSVTFIKNPEQATYPRFESYIKEFFLKDIYPNVNFRGGISMQGSKLIGKGSIDKPAELTFYRRDTLKLRSTSQYFIIRPEKIKGIDASISIYIDKDSIYHGDLQFTYTVKNNEISLMRSDKYSAQSPFINSYHKVDMNFEQLTWRIDEPVIFLTTTPGSSIGKALFESENFFNTEEYNQFQYYYNVHPLVSLKKYGAMEGSTKFTAQDFASYMRTSLENIRVLLFPLAVKGFIFYDAATEMIELKQRLYDNISASVGRIDYDVLRFFSTTNAPLENASLDLRNNDLKINGVPQIFVSDSQNVVIYPKAESIIMKRNRNFQFDGVVTAGLFTFYGRNFFFHYDDFKVSLKDVDSIQLQVIVGYDNFNKPIKRMVNNVIQDITGDILIDKPDNKSGIKSNPEYPIFNSRGYSYVYYDDRFIFNGIYDRKRNFNFRMEPYQLDSLDNFTKEGLNFEGLFSSAGIFPEIKEKLRLQPDFSLGFKHQSSSSGYPLYGGKAVYKNVLNLSNQGLRGNGEIDYLCANIGSTDFIFFPDSSNALAETFRIQAQATGTQCPIVRGDTIAIHWEPYKDNMQARNMKKPFMIYNEEISHNGLLSLSPKGLTGSGVLDLTTAVSRSNKFSYKYATIKADTSDFTLRSLHNQGYTVNTTNVSAFIDLSKRIGKFKSNDLHTVTEFPENRYIAMLDEFTWKMDDKELEMTSSRKQPASKVGEAFGFKDMPLLGSRFISTRKDQDSLSFVSPLAVYDYEKNLLQAKKVSYLEIADTRIFPEKEQITINPEGFVVSLEHAKIMANTQSRFHSIYDATVYVNSRTNYNANGNYDYKDAKNKFEKFHFHDIKVDSLGHTIAEGNITEPDSFTLSDNFPFQGRILLRAEEKFLRFDGATRILHNCPNYGSAWFLFDTLINPMDVKIPITEKMTELNRKYIIAGTIITTDSIHVYSSFFGARKNFSDSIVANATGLLRYNNFNYSYEIAKPEKFKNRDTVGNYMRLNTKTCQHYIEGTIRPGVNYGQFHHKNSGIVEHDLKANQVKVNMSMALDFFMNEKAMQRMAIIVDSLGKSSVDISSARFKKNFINLMPPTSLKKYYDELNAADVKQKTIPEIFLKTIFIDEVNLVWDDVSNSYRSKGKIGIGFIAGKQIHKYYEGYMELWRKRSGDLFDLYIKVDDQNYFYIAYTRGTLHVTSSDQVFNNIIRELSEKERTLVVGRGQMPYSFTMATERKLQMLRKRWLTGVVDEEQQKDDVPENIDGSLDNNLPVEPDTQAKPDSIKNE